MANIKPNITLYELMKGAVDFVVDSVKNKRNPMNHLEYKNGQNTAIMHHMVLNSDLSESIKQFIKEKRFMKENDSEYFIQGYNNKWKELCT
jgi:hypothetical protein